MIFNLLILILYFFLQLYDFLIFGCSIPQILLNSINFILQTLALLIDLPLIVQKYLGDLQCLLLIGTCLLNELDQFVDLSLLFRIGRSNVIESYDLVILF